MIENSEYPNKNSKDDENILIKKMNIFLLYSKLISVVL